MTRSRAALLVGLAGLTLLGATISRGFMQVIQAPGTAWTVAHVTSTAHVAVVTDTARDLVCHSRANFVTTANAIVAHGAAGLRLFVCGIFLVGDGLGTDVSVVEGTGAACGTGTSAVLGGTAAAQGIPLGYHAVTVVQPRPFTATTAGNQLCVLTSQAATRVTGAIFYGAY